MNDARIIARGLGKEYRRAPRPGANSLRGLFTRARERGDDTRFRALSEVSFSVGPGEMLGIVGANGAGKSTLLLLLGGVARPTEGTVELRGRIGALLDLGGGFQGDLTGRENARLAGVVAGLTRAEVRERMDAIVAFAGLEAFIDQPLRTYSTGMTMRLAFSVAVHTEPEVLLVDEFLSVGDLAFQARCLARIAELRRGGCCVVLVSHSMDQVRQTCDRALWLKAGRVVVFDEAKAVAGAYEAAMRAETLARTPEAPPRTLDDGRVLRLQENRFGSLEVEIERMELVPGATLVSGSPLVVRLRWRARARVASPVFVVSISREDGTVCLDTNTGLAGVAVPDLEGGGAIDLTLDRLELGAGRYFVNVGVYEPGWSHAYDYHWHVYPLVVTGAATHRGILAPPSRWSLGA